ncbi:MAG: M15 family metallopeptidase [Clostridia bacterium]|nr:M15 family metallopeptidase [Clostridia bacterium]
MQKYKHLSEKDAKRLKFFRKSGKVAKKGMKKSLIICGLLFLLGVGAISFYKVIDNGDSSAANAVCDVLTDKKEKNDDIELNPLDQKELERESEKSESIKKDDKDDKIESVGTACGDFADWNKKCSAEMIVVNKDNFLPNGYRPKIKSCRGKEIADVAFDDLNKMIDDAKKDGIKLWISSGYRSTELQTKLFNRQIEKEKSKAVISQEEAEKRAAMVVARPGTSEHNTGLAVYFNGVSDNFYTTKEYEWLMKNAHKYGFIERYQKKWKERTGVIYEPWHFRYVGKDNAEKIKNSGLCLEEYVSRNLK